MSNLHALTSNEDKTPSLRDLVKNPKHRTPTQVADTLVNVASLISSIQWKGDATAKGRLRAHVHTLRHSGNRSLDTAWMAWLEESIDWHLNNANGPGAPQWDRSPMLVDHTQIAPQPLAPSDLAWLQRMADVKPKRMTEDDAAHLAKLHAQTRDHESDHRYVTSIVEPHYDHWANRTDRNNRRIAEQYGPNTIHEITKKLLAGKLAELIQQDERFETEIAPAHSNSASYRDLTAARLAEERLAQTPTAVERIEPPHTPALPASTPQEIAGVQGRERARAYHDSPTASPLDRLTTPG